MLIETKRGPFDVLDEGRGTPLVLVHAFPLAAASWNGELQALQPGVRVIAPSMRGFGGSTRAELSTLSIDGMAADVAAVLDAKGLREPVVVGGLSMGGYVALAFARAYPERVRALILADTRAEPDTDEARAGRADAIARVESGDLAGFIDGLLEKILAPSTRRARPAVAASVRAMAMEADPRAVVAALGALRDRPDARAGLAAVAVPVLVVVGAEDGVTPPSASEALVAAIPGGRARLCVIPDAGHLSNLEQPAAFRAAVSAFAAAL